jgi:hypothetical protein
MRPPFDVPNAPPRSSTDSSAMPCPRIAVLSKVVLTPGSPEASPGVGNGSPSVCSTSYLGIPHPGQLQHRLTSLGYRIEPTDERLPVDGERPTLLKITIAWSRIVSRYRLAEPEFSCSAACRRQSCRTSRKSLSSLRKDDMLTTNM